MAIFINNYEITDSEIERELPRHKDAPNPLKRAVTTLALRRILLDESARLGITTSTEESTIEALLASEVQVPTPNEECCRRHYVQHSQHFQVGELVEVEHILFQVTSRVPLDALRELAEQSLQNILIAPHTFAKTARALSNCPSSNMGGNLGILRRGDTVPEFERVVFSMKSGEIYPCLLESRFGLHIVRVVNRVEGHLLPFEEVFPLIAEALKRASSDLAWRQYLKLLVGRAKIDGVELEGAESLLVQ